jgi:phosphohistidine swiveling domain-containing protein
MIEPTSKARTLEWVKSKVSLFQIPELGVFDAAAYAADHIAIISCMQARFAGRAVIVRSSATDEDGTLSALAGEYDSVLNVPSQDGAALRAAIECVIASYDRKGVRDGRDEILVQEMISSVSMSGVVFTHDLNTGAPYYVINYDDESGLTNTVTSGEGVYANRTLYIHRGAAQAVRSERFQQLLQAVDELETAMGSRFLDVEFALGADLTPYLFQVRAITTQPNWNRAVAKRIDAALTGIQAFVRERMAPMAGVYGKTTVLGQMPDWNPAEMIGRAPRALAFSLYKKLITDHAWRIARERMGYAPPKGQPLMVSLAGQPFIDTRLSFQSFLPAGLPPVLCEKLVDAAVSRLQTHPELHDKVEFDVVITTYSFDIDQKMAELLSGVLDEHEQLVFKQALHKQTLELLSGQGVGTIDTALAAIEELSARQFKAAETGLSAASIFELIDNCIQLGTIPFSILARHGFIARTLLLSLIRRGVLTADEVQKIQFGIHTVASELVEDMHCLQTGALAREVFMSRYGHLRPGTYDILSCRYDQMPDFGAHGARAGLPQAQVAFQLSAERKSEINRLLEVEGFGALNTDTLLEYVRAATVGREYGKFVFTRSVSDLLELVAAFGERHGLSREEMSHVSIDDVLAVISQSTEGCIEERLRVIADEGAERHVLSAAIRLPQVLFDEAGVHVVPFQVSHPNFITHKKVTAPCLILDRDQASRLLDGKIVLIENADPGFDWIFSQQIAGLITKYGGANSHMAIRCAEFGIPAAIGCGEQRFEAFLSAQQLQLDCAAGLINFLH